MGRGKIEIKKIENRTNRQVTFSKRRNGIMKKAHELTVLCDATVSLLMVSATNKLHEYLSPGASLKNIYDEYQKTLGVDVWSAHYEEMKNQERNLLDINGMLRREISRRMGGDLEDLQIHELQSLEAEMEKSIDIIRNQKYHKIKTQTGTSRKKVKNLEEMHGNLLMDLETKFGAPQFGIADDNTHGGYETSGAYTNEGAAASLYALSRHHSSARYPSLELGGGGYPNVHDLRLA